MRDRELDSSMRSAAFAHVRKLIKMHGHLTSKLLFDGFTFKGERIPLTNPRRGIFRPRQMSLLLSIRTVFPRPNVRIWYDDQRGIHPHVFSSKEEVVYAFMGKNPNAADNVRLREAYENQVPVIYFLGFSPELYQAIIPAYIAGWDAQTLQAKIVFGRHVQDEIEAPKTVDDRRYALGKVQRRLHQNIFRQAVINAYRSRCAISGLPEPQLLDAAHIISDTDERLGQPVVPNGLPLSKLHHAAFDQHLIGVDPDYRLHVSERLLDQHDGPMLEMLKQLKGRKLHLPNRPQDKPDQERLAVRYEQFSAATG